MAVKNSGCHCGLCHIPALLEHHRQHARSATIPRCAALRFVSVGVNFARRKSVQILDSEDGLRRWRVLWGAP